MRLIFVIRRILLYRHYPMIMPEYKETFIINDEIC